MVLGDRLPDIKGKAHLPAFAPQIRNVREGPARGTQEPDEFKAIQAVHVVQKDLFDVPFFERCTAQDSIHNLLVLL
jgi:hypothetical protein